jgi:hypothetical protein
MRGWYVNYKNWKGCWREWPWPNLRYYPGICLDGLRKTMKHLRIAGLQAKIWTQDLPNMKHEHLPLLRFQALMAASMKIRAFWDIVQCSLVVDCCNETTRHNIPEGSNLVNCSTTMFGSWICVDCFGISLYYVISSLYLNYSDYILSLPFLHIIWFGTS